MYYIFNNQDGTKTVVLTFLRNELLNDLDQYGFVEGDVQRTDERLRNGQRLEQDYLKHGKHQTQDITQDGNVDLVTRWLNLKLAWCREALFPWTKDPVMDNVTLDDVLDNPETYSIIMTVPEDFSDTTVVYLEELIHNLLVWWVLYHWLSITKPEVLRNGWLTSRRPRRILRKHWRSDAGRHAGRSGHSLDGCDNIATYLTQKPARVSRLGRVPIHIIINPK